MTRFRSLLVEVDWLSIVLVPALAAKLDLKVLSVLWVLLVPLVLLVRMEVLRRASRPTATCSRKR